VSDHADPEARFLDVVIAPLVRDSMLWPILGVFVGHLVVGLAFALVLGVIERRFAALAALAFALFLTWSGVRLELRVRKRPGALIGILAATWLLALVVAWIGHQYGVFQ